MTLEQRVAYELEVERLEKIAEETKNPKIITDFVFENGFWRIRDIEDIPGERWIPVVGFGDFYECSSFGRFKSLARESRRLSKNDQILNQGIAYNGYLKISFCKDGKTTHTSPHRQVGLSFIPNPSGLPQINHTKGCKLDNRVIRLEWIMVSDNQKHGYKIGVSRQDGEFHATSKLNWTKVKEIRKLYLSGMTAGELGKKYKVHEGHIRNICYNIFWKDKNYVWDTRNKK